MRFGNFLFPDSRDPAQDGAVIDETLREAALSDALGVDVVWLAEHHFDGICAYADPMLFAGALAATLKRSAIGFAVIQTALHHPIRLAEQLAVLDNLTRGRLIVGLGRGSSYNIYDYEGFGIDHREAQARLDEAEALMVKAWTGAWNGAGFAHDGQFWQVRVPILRPRPYTMPHPPVIRGASGEASLIALGRQGRPFLMNVQSIAETRLRVELYRQAMADSGFDADAIAAALGQSWVWRNVLVAPSDAEAERVGAPAFAAMTAARAELRSRLYAETGRRIAVPAHDTPQARAAGGHALLCGAPDTVAAQVAAIAATGIGGMLASFRLGPLPHAAAAESLTLFMREVAPRFRAAPAAPG